MATKTRRRFTEEFKAQAVELLQSGKPVSELAEELGIGSDLLYSWRRSAQAGSEGMRAPRTRDELSEADGLRALRRENAQLRMENDILKKAAIILGTKSPHGFGK
jgi:transposase